MVVEAGCGLACFGSLGFGVVSMVVREGMFVVLDRSFVFFVCRDGHGRKVCFCGFVFCVRVLLGLVLVLLCLRVCA